MPMNRRLLHSLIVLLVVLLGFAAAAPAGIAAQGDDDDDDTTTPAVIAPPDEDSSGTDDADSDDQDAPDEFIIPDEIDNADLDNDDPPDCDDGGWRIVTTEDGTGFRNEDHCEDHVAAHGDDSLVVVGAAEDDAYVVVTMPLPSRANNPCTATTTLVDGQDGRSVYVVIDDSNPSQFVFILTVSSDHPTPSHTEQIDWGDNLEDGIAIVLDSSGKPTGETIPVYFTHPYCG